MQHLEEGTIHAWLDGALPPDEAAAVEAHARSCAECAAAVAEARGMIAGAARIVSALDIPRGGVLPSAPAAARPAPYAPRPASGASLWRRLHLTPSRAALAATILVAVSGTLVVRHQRSLDDAMYQGRLIDSPIPMPSVEQPVRRDSIAVTPPPKASAPVERAKNDTKNEPSARKAAKPSNPLPAQSPASTPVLAPAPAAATGAAAAVNGAVASTSAPPPPSSATAANVDTTARPLAKSGERADLTATIAASRLRAPMIDQRFETAAITSVPGIVGCYQLSSQPADSAFGSLPNRFALERGSANAPQNNRVRNVSPEGRVDSVIAGTTWRQAAPNQVSILFANTGVVNRTVELELTQARATSRTARGAVSTLPIRRVNCVR
jgi:putative zinc finger protein